MVGYPRQLDGTLRRDGHSPVLIRRASPFARMLSGFLSAAVLRVRAVADAWRHPRSTVAGWRKARRWPRPEDLDHMSPEAFDAYVEKIGFDARIKAALAEPVADGIQADRERGVSTGAGSP